MFIKLFIIYLTSIGLVTSIAYVDSRHGEDVLVPVPKIETINQNKQELAPEEKPVPLKEKSQTNKQAENKSPVNKPTKAEPTPAPEKTMPLLTPIVEEDKGGVSDTIEPKKEDVPKNKENPAKNIKELPKEDTSNK